MQILNNEPGSRDHSESPFHPGQGALYGRWRQWKLDGAPARLDELRVKVADPYHISAGEYRGILERCRRANMAIYRFDQCPPDDKLAVRALGRAFGLTALDGNLCADGDDVTSLTVRREGMRAEYIPYSDRALNWHTDGYYNLPAQRIRAIVMHCARPAAEGGANGFMDPELIYIRLRDEDPELVRALMQPDTMTIPANVHEGRQLRGPQSGPVFFVEPGTGNLGMRYTARRRNIVWKDDPRVREGVARIQALLESPDGGALRGRLRSGEGIICNNVLHSRAAFDDGPGPGRLLFRARYYDRIAGTGIVEVLQGISDNALA